MPKAARRGPAMRTWSGPERTWSVSPKAKSRFARSHCIDLKIAVQDLGIDFEEIAKSAADGIMDQHRRRAELGLHSGNHGVELHFVCHVAGIAFGIGDLPF
jgi:hypothetical protein